MHVHRRTHEQEPVYVVLTLCVCVCCMQVSSERLLQIIDNGACADMGEDPAAMTVSGPYTHTHTHSHTHSHTHTHTHTV